MSNFYKQYNIIEKQRAVRVIDYNSMVEEKLATLAAKQNSSLKGKEGETADGFQSLDSVAADLVRENPEEVLQKAKDEAELILKDAKEKSDAILKKSEEESKEILQKAKEDGQKEGYLAGEQQVRQELEAEYQKKAEELEEFKLELQADYNQEMNQLEPKLLDVILTVIEKVFHIQFDDKKDILLYLVQNTIQNIEGSRNFHIRVGEEEKLFLENHKEEILDRVGQNVLLEIVSDPLLEGNQCVIETETGVFDCGLGVQLENLIKDLRSLSS